MTLDMKFYDFVLTSYFAAKNPANIEIWLEKEMSARIERDLQRIIIGNGPKPRLTALRLHKGFLETVKIDDDGKIIEPPQQCSKCGPIFCCPKHMQMT